MEDRSLVGVLAPLLERADVLGDIEVSHDEVSTWPPGVHASLVELGLLARASNALGLACDGCEESCWVEPDLQRAGNGSMTLVHLCHRRDDIGILRYPPQRLEQWTLNGPAIARLVATSLTQIDGVEEVVDGVLWRVGDRRIHGALRTFFLVGPGISMTDEIRAHLGHRHAVLLCPHVRPEVPCRTITLTEVLGDELGIDESVLGQHLGRRLPAPKSVGRIGIPEGTTWANITIRVIDEHTVEVVAGRDVTRRTFAELGMLDRRRRDAVPKAAWGLLLVLASNTGSLGWGDQGASDNARQHMKSLRTLLREAFGIEDDPIHEYKRERCWRTRFQLADWRDHSAP